VFLGGFRASAKKRSRDRIFLAAVEACAGDIGEVVAKSSAAGGCPLNGAL
jgi:hypothetical protein